MIKIIDTMTTVKGETIQICQTYRKDSDGNDTDTEYTFVSFGNGRRVIPQGWKVTRHTNPATKIDGYMLKLRFNGKTEKYHLAHDEASK